MLRHLEVSRLTRPARLRCRPTLISRSKWTSTKPLPSPIRVPKFKTASAVKQRTGDEPSLGRRRDEQADYMLAKSIQSNQSPPKQHPGASPTASSSRPLPTLRNTKSFHSSRPTEYNSGQAETPSLKGKEKEIPSTPTPSAPRRNPVGVQLLSPSLHQQLFPGPSRSKPLKSLVQLSTQHLLANGLEAKDAAVLEEINLDMPPLRGKDIRDHFHTLGQESAEPYLSLARQFAEIDLPPMPEAWVTDMSGWIKYNADGSFEPVDDLGDEKMVSFDVEVLYKISPYPIMATAVSPNAWYSWLCPTIFQEPPSESIEPAPRWDKTTRSHLPHDLIPLFAGKDPRLVIGHNVGYDRARIKEEYNLQRTSTRYMDTLSLHVATRGMTSVQRPVWMKHRKSKNAKQDEEEELREAIMDYYSENGDGDFAATLTALSELDEVSDDVTSKRWEDITAVNSLAEVAKLHCGTPVDKSIRDRFGDEELKHASQLRDELYDLLQYCGNDVRITHDVYKKVFPLFLESCPHPASFAGALSMGNSFLPINESWAEYLKDAEEKYKEMELGVTRNLRSLAEKLRRDGPKDDDPWISQLDWSPKRARWADEGPDAPPAAVKALREAFTDPNTTKTVELVSAVAEPKTVELVTTQASPDTQRIESEDTQTTPTWLAMLSDPKYLSTPAFEKRVLPLILRMSYRGHPVVFLSKEWWCFQVPKESASEYIADHGEPVQLSESDGHLADYLKDSVLFRLTKANASRRSGLTGNEPAKMFSSGLLTSPYPDVLRRVYTNSVSEILPDLTKCANDLSELGQVNDWGMQLDWTPPTASQSAKSTRAAPGEFGTWPKWYWDMTKPVTQLPPGELDISQKKSVTPLLLRLKWSEYPLVLSKNYRWIYRVPCTIIDHSSSEARLNFGDHLTWPEELTGDETYRNDRDHYYFRLPHQRGEGKNVGSPLAKGFVQFLESGRLSSAGSLDGDDATARIANDATQMNVLCSYWVSARERIMDQMVVYDTPNSGMILPQVITMGTVTRRAVESTWLTASNAKKNRVGSELKAMVRAPPGYAIVGADVDSEELWISSVMGDAQFGMHGATAIGWMTLEGTKAAGTDLHSKTASILGTSRDAAKVFNYSRIYGAGVKHAVQLLMQGDATLTKEEAMKKARALYTATKGEKSRRDSRLPLASIPSLWHGGSESFLFNTLESIAISDRPTTPALGCGVTKALSKLHLSTDDTFLPSRINWVVQSSGVDYLHLLIVSMEYLTKRYDIDARYLISVHDEVRYLAKESDKYRAALALQIANAWTRALFCYNLGIDDVPQGVTFFSAVDIDHVLRKEVFMPCVTPSHPTAIAPGESLDMKQLLDKGITLGNPVESESTIPANNDLTSLPLLEVTNDITSQQHYAYLQAQADRKSVKARTWLNNQPDELDLSGQALPSPQAVREVRQRDKQYRKEKIKSIWDEISLKDLDLTTSVFTGRPFGSGGGSSGSVERSLTGRALPQPVIVNKKTPV